MESIANCKKCGLSLNPDWNFCENCGAAASPEPSRTHIANSENLLPHGQEEIEEFPRTEVPLTEEKLNQELLPSISDKPNPEFNQEAQGNQNASSLNEKPKGSRAGLVTMTTLVAVISIGLGFSVAQVSVTTQVTPQIDSATQSASDSMAPDKEAEGGQTPEDERTEEPSGFGVSDANASPQSSPNSDGNEPDMAEEAKGKSESGDAETEVQALSVEDWLKAGSANLVTSRLAIGGVCPAEYCALHELELTFTDPSTVSSQDIELLISPPLGTEVLKGGVLRLTSGQSKARIQLLELLPESPRTYKNTFPLKVSEVGTAANLSFSLSANSLDLSSFADEVLKPVLPIINDYDSTIPGMENLKSELVSSGVCARFSQTISRSGFLECYLEQPNSVLGIAATGPAVSMTTSSSWLPKFTAYGAGWAIEVHDGSGKLLMSTLRQLGALFFRSSELECEIDVSPPNFIPQCLSF